MQASAVFSLSYDLAGNRNREQIDTNVTGSTFNKLNELTAQSAGGPMEFTGSVYKWATITLAGKSAAVDASGNWRGTASVTPGANAIPLVAKDVNGNTTTKTIAITISGGASRTLTYDLDGSMITDGAGKLYSYDAANRLLTITQGPNVTTFVYNGLGQRVQEKLNGTVIKQWVWAGGAQPAEERDASNNVTKRFYAQGEQIGGTSYFFTTDHLGSVREMTDSTGAVRARYDYDPYGRITKVSGDLESDFGFTGFYRHQASGLNLALYRAYDANLGRWPNRDPIAERGGINLYGYVYNDPINGVDPLGLKPGDHYKKLDEAASQAIRDINPTSIKNGHEYMGLLYQNSDETYSYTSPNEGTADSSSPGFLNTIYVQLFKKLAGDYHTHGGCDSQYDNENFGNADMDGNDYFNLPGYLGTPNGDIKKYTPNPGHPRKGKVETLVHGGAK